MSEAPVPAGDFAATDWSTRVALVTGASSGIGAAIAAALAERGCRVVAAARRTDRLAALQGRFGERCHPLEIDLTDTASLDRLLLDSLPEPFRAVDILVNAAGHDVGGKVPFDQSRPSDWAGVLAVNLTALARLTQLVLPGMLARDRGDIINIGSVTTRRTASGLTAYAASKHGVHGFTEGLRADYAGTGIRITEIIPGMVRTEFALRRWRGDRMRADAFYDDAPGWLTAGDVARCALWALEQPAGVTVGEIVVLPTREPR